jgi:phage terminase small subunit
VRLTANRQLFIANYLTDPKRNGAKAAIAAGFSRKRAKITACELLKDPEIEAEIERQTSMRLEKLHLDADMVIAGLVAEIENSKKAGSGAWQASTRLKAYELLGRHLKMFTDKVEFDVDDLLIERLLAGRKRAGLPEQSAGPP